MTRLWSLMMLMTLAMVGASLVIGRAQPTAEVISFSMDHEQKSEIYMLDIARALAHPITQHHEPTSYGTLRWSPDGTQIAYVEAFGQRRRLHVLNFACCVTSLSESYDEDYNPAWLNEHSLIFVSNRDRQSEIYRYDTQTGNLENLTQNATPDDEPSPSPDSRYIAFTSLRDSNREIYIYDTACTNDCYPQNISQNAGDDFTPVWSPDGQWIAFVSDRTWNYDLFIMDTSGGQVRNLTRSHGEEWFPVWSPDSQYIAFLSDRPGNYEIYTAEVASGRISNMSNNPANDIGPVWSPNGQTIAFLSFRDGAYNIYMANRDGSQVRAITQGNTSKSIPTWKPNDQTATEVEISASVNPSRLDTMRLARPTIAAEPMPTT